MQFSEGSFHLMIGPVLILVTIWKPHPLGILPYHYPWVTSFLVCLFHCQFVQKEVLQWVGLWSTIDLIPTCALWGSTWGNFQLSIRMQIQDEHCNWLLRGFLVCLFHCEFVQKEVLWWVGLWSTIDLIPTCALEEVLEVTFNFSIRTPSRMNIVTCRYIKIRSFHTAGLLASLLFTSRSATKGTTLSPRAVTYWAIPAPLRNLYWFRWTWECDFIKSCAVVLEIGHLVI